MSLRKPSQFKNFALPEGSEATFPEDVLDRWHASLRVKALSTAAATIDIYGEIGKDPWTGDGVSAEDVAASLKTAGSGDVVVNINSPGGVFFEGTAIYNLLASHPGKVTTRNIGLAASAASLIFMAGDERLMAPASFVMIHNAWSITMGDRHDHQASADTLGSIDGAIRDLYVEATGKHSNSVSTMMDDETWLNTKDAIAANFATGKLAAGDISEDAGAKAMADPQKARMRAESIFQQHGMSRSKRRELMNQLRNPGAPRIDNQTPETGDILADLRKMRSRLDAQPLASDDPAKPGAGFRSISQKLLDSLNSIQG